MPRGCMPGIGRIPEVMVGVIHIADMEVVIGIDTNGGIRSHITRAVEGGVDPGA